MNLRKYAYLFISTALSIGLLYVLVASLKSTTEAANDLLTSSTESSISESLRWRTFADIPKGRGDPGVTVYKDKIYAISGFFSPGKDYVNNVAIYSPSTDSWDVRWGVPKPRSDLMAATVGDKIYAIGGWLEDVGAQGDNHRYDPELNIWITMTSMITAVSGAGVAVIDEDIYIIGGFDGARNRNSVQIYDPSSDIWSQGANMPNARSELGSAFLNGKIYAIGGVLTAGGSSTTTNSVDIYDPILNSWSSGTSLPEPRASIAVAVRDGKIFVIGGTDLWKFDSTGEAVDTTYMFDPQLDQWSKGVPMPTARFGNEAAVVEDRIHVIGGSGNPGAGTANEAYGDFPIVFIPFTTK